MLKDIIIQAKGKSKDKPFTLSDGQGLSLLVRPNGTRLWLYRYTFAGKRQNMSLGQYPAVSLAKARKKRFEAETALEAGQDPVVARNAKKPGKTDYGRPTFRKIGDEWLAKQDLAAATIERETSNLHRLYESIGDLPIAEITSKDIIEALDVIEKRGTLYTLQRTRETAARVFAYAIARHHRRDNPAAGLDEAHRPPPKATARPALTDPADVGELMRRIASYDGPALVGYALKLLALTMVRPGELRKAEWSEFTDSVWTISGPKMKMRKDHEVPLSRQALAIVAEVRKITGHRRYLFSNTANPMPEPYMCEALRDMGYDTKSEHCAHGFRSMASSLLNAERKNSMPVWHPDVIEMQLAHGDPDSVRGIYNRAMYWPDRVAMMQHLADRLDHLRDGAAVVPLRQAR
jgi:integrase